MKAIYVLITFMLIHIINSHVLEEFGTMYCDDYSYKHPLKPAFSVDHCSTTIYNYTRCCHLEWKDTDGKRRYSCQGVNNVEFANIDDTIANLEKIDEIVEVESLDCHSSYLFGTLLLLLSLFF